VEKNIHFMLINAPDCATCLFSWYGLLITVAGVGGEWLSQTRQLQNVRYLDE